LPTYTLELDNSSHAPSTVKYKW